MVKNEVGGKTKGKWRVSSSKVSVSPELDIVSSNAFTHRIAFPHGTPTQLAGDRQIIVLTLAYPVPECSNMIGLLTVTDGKGEIMEPDSPFGETHKTPLNYKTMATQSIRENDLHTPKDAKTKLPLQIFTRTCAHNRNGLRSPYGREIKAQRPEHTRSRVNKCRWIHRFKSEQICPETVLHYNAKLQRNPLSASSFFVCAPSSSLPAYLD